MEKLNQKSKRVSKGPPKRMERKEQIQKIKKGEWYGVSQMSRTERGPHNGQGEEKARVGKRSKKTKA